MGDAGCTLGGRRQDPFDAMSPPKLFEPLRVGALSLANRIVIAPMCQYSAEEGRHTPWHTTHLGGIVQRGVSSAPLG